jgi:hypothetical protein
MRAKTLRLLFNTKNVVYALGGASAALLLTTAATSTTLTSYPLYIDTNGSIKFKPIPKSILFAKEKKPDNQDAECDLKNFVCYLLSSSINNEKKL